MKVAALIRQVAETHGDIADPRDLVPLVMAEAAGYEKELLAAALPQYVSAVLRRARRHHAAAEPAWATFLDERIPTEDGYVFGRDADPASLDAGAERRFRFAGNLDRRGQQWRAISTAMQQAGVTRAGDLPQESGVDAIASLESDLATIKHIRLREQRKVNELDALRRARDILLTWIEAHDSPALHALRVMRTELQQRRDELRDAIERGQRTDEILGAR